MLYKLQHFKKSRVYDEMFFQCHKMLFFQSVQLKQTDCDICKLVVNYIDKFLKENSTEVSTYRNYSNLTAYTHTLYNSVLQTEAKDLIEKICTVLGSDAQQVYTMLCSVINILCV